MRWYRGSPVTDWETLSRWKHSEFQTRKQHRAPSVPSRCSHTTWVFTLYVQDADFLVPDPRFESESANYSASYVTLSNFLPLSKSQPLKPAPRQEKLYHSVGHGTWRPSPSCSSKWLSIYTEYLCSSQLLGLYWGWLGNISDVWVPSIILCTHIHIYWTVFEDGSRIQRNPLRTTEVQLFISKEGWDEAGTEENSGCVSNLSYTSTVRY